MPTEDSCHVLVGPQVLPYGPFMTASLPDSGDHARWGLFPFHSLSPLPPHIPVNVPSLLADCSHLTRHLILPIDDSMWVYRMKPKNY